MGLTQDFIYGIVRLFETTQHSGGKHQMGMHVLKGFAERSPISDLPQKDFETHLGRPQSPSELELVATLIVEAQQHEEEITAGKESREIRRARDRFDQLVNAASAAREKGDNEMFLDFADELKTLVETSRKLLDNTKVLSLYRIEDGIFAHRDFLKRKLVPRPSRKFGEKFIFRRPS